MSRIDCEGLWVGVADRPLIQDLSMTLTPGELLGIVGTNGAGKSTLLRTLVGLIPPASGSIRLDGVALDAWPAAARARRIGYLPQYQPVCWPLPGRDLVALGRLPHGDAHHDSGRCAVDRAMRATQTHGFADATVQMLSGGERARVMLARVLAGDPAVLLADEPLTALDPAHQLRMMALLEQQARCGRAVAVVLHDLMLAARYCTRVLVMREGRMLADGAPGKVLDDSLLAESFGIEAVRLTHAGSTGLVPWRLASTTAELVA